MSFTEAKEGLAYAPGYFLAHEDCVRVTYEIADDLAAVKTAANGGKYVPMGTVIKVNDTAVGLLYEDVDVSTGNMPGSVVVEGVVYENRLSVATADKTALTKIKFIAEPTVTRP